MRTRVFVLVALLGAALLTTTTLRAEVDVEVDLTVQVTGSVAPEGEVETLTFRGLAGTVLSAAVTPKSPGFTLNVVLRGPSDQVLPLGSLVLPETGDYRLVIAGTGTGEYQLKMKGAPPKKYAEGALAVPGGGSTVLPLALLPGSVLTL
jgi:hypothetical protein